MNLSKISFWLQTSEPRQVIFIGTSSQVIHAIFCCSTNTDNWRGGNYNQIYYCEDLKGWYCSKCCCVTKALGAHKDCIKAHKYQFDLSAWDCSEEYCVFGCCVLEHYHR